MCIFLVRMKYSQPLILNQVSIYWWFNLCNTWCYDYVVKKSPDGGDSNSGSSVVGFIVRGAVALLIVIAIIVTVILFLL